MLLGFKFITTGSSTDCRTRMFLLTVFLTGGLLGFEIGCSFLFAEIKTGIEQAEFNSSSASACLQKVSFVKVMLPSS